MEQITVHKAHLQRRFRSLVKGINPLSPMCKDLFIIQTHHKPPFIDLDEVRYTEQTCRYNPNKCSEMFQAGHNRRERIRVVMTMGAAGIGKTVSVQNFILDWAEGTSSQDVDFILPLPFRELNFMKEKTISLVELITLFFSNIKDPRVLTSSEHKVMFIFDGLDECRLPLDFDSNPKCCDVSQAVPVDVLLTNLIEGNLLPSSLIWITTRPAAVNQIPYDHIDQFTEKRGYSKHMKEEYFKKRMSDGNLASRTISYIKTFRDIRTMSRIPAFCSIAATVIERLSDGSESVVMPRTLTQMYTHYLNIQTSTREDKDVGMIVNLGKLAFQQLEEGKQIFYDDDLRKSGIDVTAATEYAGVFSQIFREEAVIHHGKVFSFVHLSIQEFLAALHVFLCFINRERDMPDQQGTCGLSSLLRAATQRDLYQKAVDLNLKNEHLHLFVRFLVGFSLESNQSLLRYLLPHASYQSQSSEHTVQIVKQEIGNHSMSGRISLLYLLNELNHHAVVEHIDRHSRTLSVEMLIPKTTRLTKQFRLNMSENQMDGFDLQKYIKTPEMDQTDLLNHNDVLERLMPVVSTSVSALMETDILTENSCSYLATALMSHFSNLRQLKLSYNRVWDSGVELLCSALSHMNCRLEELQIVFCGLTVESCSYLASALTSPASRLKQLNLSDNNLQDSGVKLLCSALGNLNCKLEQLQLWGCHLTEKSCSYLASALMSHFSNLRQLKLSHNRVQDSGVELLCSALSHINCRLEELQIVFCELTERSCSYLASALTSPASQLKQLNLSDNNLRDSGVKLLCSALQHPNCKLEELQLWGCRLTEKSCSYLASVLTSNSSHLKQLDLSNNSILQSGVELLISALTHYNCALETLELKSCKLTESVWACLLSALNSGICSLRHLILREDGLQTHQETLSALLQHPNCPLETLQLNDETYKKEPSASARSSHPSDTPEVLCVDTPKGCVSCDAVPDTMLVWILVKPEVSTDEGVSTYTLRVPGGAGSYECSVSHLRWLCAGPVTLKYHFMDWYTSAEELTHMQCSPAGPLMEIKCISGKLEEIHLPHFLCLGGDESPVRDAVRVLHRRDDGVCVETCELTRHHARLVQPSLSALGVIYYITSLVLPVKVHSKVLVYQCSASRRVFRSYLLPEDARLKQEVQKDEDRLGGVWRDSPHPPNPLQMNDCYRLDTDCTSNIYPDQLVLRYSGDTPNFFKVKLPDPALTSFHMQLFSSAPSRGQPVWRAEFESAHHVAPTQDRQTRTRDQAEGPVSPLAVGTTLRSFAQTSVAPSLSQNQVQRDVNITTHFHEERRCRLL